MPKVINTLDFKKKMKYHLENMDGYMIVANETYKNRSFIVVEPDVMIGLCAKAGNMDYADGIVSAVDDIKQKVSNKYKRIRSLAE